MSAHHESQQHYFTGNETDLNNLAVNIGDFGPFYIAIAISSIILGSIFILNIICCCSRYSDYWLDPHTGNRWIVSLWTTTPHKQAPLDLTELEAQTIPVQYIHTHSEYEYNREELPSSVSRQPLTSSHEYLELHKRESDI